MAEVKVLEMRSVPAVAEDRKGKRDWLAFYSVNGGPARFCRVPEEGFSEASLLAEIRKQENIAGTYRGKTLQL